MVLIPRFIIISNMNPNIHRKNQINEGKWCGYILIKEFFFFSIPKKELIEPSSSSMGTSSDFEKE